MTLSNTAPGILQGLICLGRISEFLSIKEDISLYIEELENDLKNK